MTDRLAYARHYALAHHALATNFAAVYARHAIDGKGPPTLDDLASAAHAAAMAACKREDEQFGPDEIEVRQLKRDLVDAEKAAQSYERVVGGSVERLANILWAADDPKRPNLDEIGLDDPELWESVFAALDANMVDACRTVAAQRDELDTAKRRAHDLHDQLESLLWSTLQPGEDGRPASDMHPEVRGARIVRRVGELVELEGNLVEQLDAERNAVVMARAQLREATDELAKLRAELAVDRKALGDYYCALEHERNELRLIMEAARIPAEKRCTRALYDHVLEIDRERIALRAEVHDHEDRQALEHTVDADTAAAEKLAEQTASGVWLSEPTTLAGVV